MNRQEIVAVIQEGRCSGVNGTNPYAPEDRKRYLGWEYGHERTVTEHRQKQQHDDLPLWRKLLCKIGFHEYALKRVPGRPHIKNNRIVGRDPIIKKYSCVYCPAVYFVGLDG